MNDELKAVTKVQFVAAFESAYTTETMREDAKFIAGVWWDLHTAVDTVLPYQLNRACVASFSCLESMIDVFVELWGKSISFCELTEMIKNVCDEEFEKAMFFAVESVFLYDETWNFYDPDSYECHPISGGVGDEDYDWFVEQYQKSVDAADALGISVRDGNVFHSDLAVLENYKSACGKIENPNTGMGIYDPLLTMKKEYVRTKVPYEHNKMVVYVSDAELYSELLSIVSEDVIARAKKNIRARKLAK